MLFSSGVTSADHFDSCSKDYTVHWLCACLLGSAAEWNWTAWNTEDLLLCTKSNLLFVCC